MRRWYVVIDINSDGAADGVAGGIQSRVVEVLNAIDRRAIISGWYLGEGAGQRIDV